VCGGQSGPCRAGAGRDQRSEGPLFLSRPLPKVDSPITLLVLAVYSVDDFDSLGAVTEHHYRFCAIPSSIDFVGVSCRSAQWSICQYLLGSVKHIAHRRLSEYEFDNYDR
jgi:hypothetical protein